MVNSIMAWLKANLLISLGVGVALAYLVFIRK